MGLKSLLVIALLCLSFACLATAKLEGKGHGKHKGKGKGKGHQKENKEPKSRCKDKMGESLSEAKKALADFEEEQRPLETEAMALRDCKELLELNDDILTKCYASLSKSDTQDSSTWSSGESSYFKAWTSAVMTNEATCLEGLAEANLDPSRYNFITSMLNTSKLSAESLRYMNDVEVRGRRKLLAKNVEPLPDYGHLRNDGFPSWLPRGDRRRLLQDNVIVANLTVAQDGSGNFTTISEAIAAAPNKSVERFTIHITAGVYQENVEVPKSKPNIMLFGDGIDVTVITGNRSVVDGFTTFLSATFVAVGQKFIAKDITFENTAGPEKHQAVALRSGSDLSVFYRCSFKAYQDTLYTHSLRQFYRECDIYGTVDFVFGNAAVVLQNCNLFARKPMSGQTNLFTAQGRTDPNQNTGISLHNCSILADADLAAVKDQFQSYLGRPWKEYSRTVYMQSFIDDVINPKGWLEWSGTFALATLYYGEYNNTGPGSGTDQRVTWPGYRVMNTSEANAFTVTNFIIGDVWLPPYNVPFTPELL